MCVYMCVYMSMCTCVHPVCACVLIRTYIMYDQCCGAVIMFTADCSTVGGKRIELSVTSANLFRSYLCVSTVVCMFVICSTTYVCQGCIQKFRQGGANLGYGQKGGAPGESSGGIVRCMTQGGANAPRPPPLNTALCVICMYVCVHIYVWYVFMYVWYVRVVMCVLCVYMGMYVHVYVWYGSHR